MNNARSRAKLSRRPSRNPWPPITVEPGSDAERVLAKMVEQELHVPHHRPASCQTRSSRPKGSRNRTDPERLVSRIPTVVAGLPHHEAQRVLLIGREVAEGERAIQGDPFKVIHLDQFPPA
jgi:hypothetical protein